MYLHTHTPSKRGHELWIEPLGGGYYSAAPEERRVGVVKELENRRLRGDLITIFSI